MAYLLDSNVFIQANKLYYGMDFCPAFWDWLIQYNSAKKVFSIEKVWDELKVIEDNLSKWASKRDAEFFLKPDEHVLQSLVEVSRWINTQDYTEGAKKYFSPGCRLLSYSTSQNKTIHYCYA